MVITRDLIEYWGVSFVSGSLSLLLRSKLFSKWVLKFKPQLITCSFLIQDWPWSANSKNLWFFFFSPWQFNNIRPVVFISPFSLISSILHISIVPLITCFCETITNCVIAKRITKHTMSAPWVIRASLLELLNSSEVHIDCFLLFQKQVGETKEAVQLA